MKSAFLACLLSLCAPAFAADVPLPSPLVCSYYTTVCNGKPAADGPVAWTSATGFSADGNYVNGVSSGYVSLAYHRTLTYCLLDVWDLAGNVVSVTPQPVVTCAEIMKLQPQFVTWTNAGGYEAYTVTKLYLWFDIISSRYAVLVTP